jgi:hypothetical protein
MDFKVQKLPYSQTRRVTFDIEYPDGERPPKRWHDGPSGPHCHCRG